MQRSVFIRGNKTMFDVHQNQVFRCLKYARYLFCAIWRIEWCLKYEQEQWYHYSSICFGWCVIIGIFSQEDWRHFLLCCSQLDAVQKRNCLDGQMVRSKVWPNFFNDTFKTPLFEALKLSYSNGWKIYPTMFIISQYKS